MSQKSIADETVEEHQSLLTLLDSTINNVVSLSKRIALLGDTSHEEDGFYLRFTQHQALSASSIRCLVLTGKYADAFKIARTMFESFLMFQLMIRGFIYQKTLDVKIEKKTYKEACEDIIKRYQRDKEEGKAEHILDVQTSSDYRKLIVTYRGLFSSDAKDDPIPFYYFAFADYDSQRHLIDRIPRIQESDFFPEITKKWQLRHQSLGELMSFKGMKKSLLLNSIYTEETFIPASVHYHFLSVFVHPNRRSMEILERNVVRSYIEPSEDVCRYDHYLCELALLYPAFLLKYYLEELFSYLPRHFTIDENYLSTAFVGFEEFSYFWFLRESPHEYDRIVFETVKHMRKGQEGVELRELPYYKDPLHRLVRMHSSFTEGTTGLTYQSPFHRADASAHRH